VGYGYRAFFFLEGGLFFSLDTLGGEISLDVLLVGRSLDSDLETAREEVLLFYHFKLVFFFSLGGLAAAGAVFLSSLFWYRI
jgi:hypothetical protein